MYKLSQKGEILNFEIEGLNTLAKSNVDLLERLSKWVCYMQWWIEWLDGTPTKSSWPFQRVTILNHINLQLFKLTILEVQWLLKLQNFIFWKWFYSFNNLICTTLILMDSNTITRPYNTKIMKFITNAQNNMCFK